MRDFLILFVHLIVTVVRLAGPGGLRSVVAESVLAQHPLLILNLYFNPGGLAGWVFGIRDDWLRKLAARKNIHVPSLVADRLVEEEAMPTPELGL